MSAKKSLPNRRVFIILFSTLFMPTAKAIEKMNQITKALLEPTLNKVLIHGFV
jgi:hypothetical protein